MIIESTGKDNEEGVMAKLVSPVKNSTNTSTVANKTCLSITYEMSGGSVGSISVHRFYSTSHHSQVWEHFGSSLGVKTAYIQWLDDGRSSWMEVHAKGGAKEWRMGILAVELDTCSKVNLPGTVIHLLYRATFQQKRQLLNFSLLYFKTLHYMCLYSPR